MEVAPSSSKHVCLGRRLRAQFIVLIFDFPEDLFENVFHRHQTANGSKLIHNNGHMRAALRKSSIS